MDEKIKNLEIWRASEKIPEFPTSQPALVLKYTYVQWILFSTCILEGLQQISDYAGVSSANLWFLFYLVQVCCLFCFCVGQIFFLWNDKRCCWPCKELGTYLLYESAIRFPSIVEVKVWKITQYPMNLSSHKLSYVYDKSH